MSLSGYLGPQEGRRSCIIAGAEQCRLPGDRKASRLRLGCQASLRSRAEERLLPEQAPLGVVYSEETISVLRYGTSLMHATTCAPRTCPLPATAGSLCRLPNLLDTAHALMGVKWNTQIGHNSHVTQGALNGAVTSGSRPELSRPTWNCITHSAR